MDLLAEDGKEYIEICVNPNTYPVNYRGEYHYRSGSTKQQLKGQALNMVTFCGLHKTTLQSPQTILQLDEIDVSVK